MSDGGEASRQRVFVGIPAYDGLAASCFVALHRLHRELHARGIGIDLAVLSNSGLIHDVRNQLLAQFVAGACDHGLFLDSDVDFQTNTVVEMLALDLDCVVAAVPERGVRWELVEQETEETGTGFENSASFHARGQKRRFWGSSFVSRTKMTRRTAAKLSFRSLSPLPSSTG